MLKGIRLKLYTNLDQRVKLNQMFGNDRKVWNVMLEMLQKRYANNPSLKMLTAFEMDALLPCLKDELYYLKKSDSSSLQVVCDNLYKAYLAFFNHTHGAPGFHGKTFPRQSYTGKSRILVKGKHYLFVPKLGIVKCSKTTDLTNCKIKRYTVSKDPDQNYYISFQVEFDNQELSKTNRVVGIDLGTHDLAITSDGTKFAKLTFGSLENQIKKAQSKYSKRYDNINKHIKELENKHALVVKPLENYRNLERLKHHKAKLQRKLANCRKDILHKITTQLVQQYDVIVIENLRVSNMLKNHKLAHAIANHAWYTFRTMLEYKCNWYGKTLIVVDPKDTSRICNNCGIKNSEFGKLSKSQWLNTRSWTCPNCGETLDRDINAAKNILARGLKQLELAK